MLSFGFVAVTDYKDDDMVCPKIAAVIVGLSTSTLAKLRCQGGGPPYYQPRRSVSYLVGELRAWKRESRRTQTPGRAAKPQNPQNVSGSASIGGEGSS